MKSLLIFAVAGLTCVLGEESTVVECDSELEIEGGSSFTIKNSKYSCYYGLNVARHTKVTVTCDVFELDCSDAVLSYFSTEGASDKFCGTADHSKTFRDVSWESTISVFYDVKNWGSTSAKLSCTIVGECTRNCPAPEYDTANEEGLDFLPKDCGVSVAAAAAEETSRILHGRKANDKEFPWMVKLDVGSICGATIINEEWLLTAAHCVNALDKRTDDGKVTACLGTNDMLNCATEIKSSKVIMYPQTDYVAGSAIQPNDIALIKLSQPLTFDDAIRPVCLPARPSNQPEGGTDLQLAGWGYNTMDDLKTAWVQVESKYRCVYSHPFHAICAKAPEESAKGSPGWSCNGDSGGYAGATNGQGRAVQYGVIAHGKEVNGFCANYSGLTDVSYYVDWIKETIQAN